MVKAEVILGVIASSIAITAFLARAIANIRQGRRAQEEASRQESQHRREISPPE
jgi:hypothetical protein